MTPLNRILLRNSLINHETLAPILCKQEPAGVVNNDYLKCILKSLKEGTGMLKVSEVKLFTCFISNKTIGTGKSTNRYILLHTKLKV